MAKYLIHENYIEALEKKLRTIEAKCSKLGCHFNYTRGNEVYKEVGENDDRSILLFYEVEVSGVAIINDWEVIAKVDHEDDGVIIRKVCFDVELPPKYTVSDYRNCEHCNSNRQRNCLYVLRNTKTGEWKQVGASCLKVFTNGLDAESAARWFSVFDELESYDEVRPSVSKHHYYRTEDYLCYVAECMNKFGWASSSSFDSYGTSYRAMEYFLLKEFGQFHGTYDAKAEVEATMESVNFNAKTSENVEKVKKVIEYFRNVEPDCDYILTLKTLAHSEYFYRSNKNFLASMIKAYDNSMDKIAKEEEHKRAIANCKSKHLGQVKDKLTLKVDKVECVTSWESQFGITWMYRIIDVDGNILIWRTSTWLDLDKNFDEVTCTVKEHSEYDGMLQTDVIRCKFTYK